MLDYLFRQVIVVVREDKILYGTKDFGLKGEFHINLFNPAFLNQIGYSKLKELISTISDHAYTKDFRPLKLEVFSLFPLSKLIINSLHDACSENATWLHYRGEISLVDKANEVIIYWGEDIILISSVSLNKTIHGGINRLADKVKRKLDDIYNVDFNIESIKVLTKAILQQVKLDEEVQVKAQNQLGQVAEIGILKRDLEQYVRYYSDQDTQLIEKLLAERVIKSNIAVSIKYYGVCQPKLLFQSNQFVQHTYPLNFETLDLARAINLVN